MVDDSRRCTAKGEQTGERCKRPAVPGKRVCYMHGARGGATKRNLDSLIHGAYAARVLNEEEQAVYDGFVARIREDFEFNDSSDEVAVHMAAMAFLQFARAQETGKEDAANVQAKIVRDSLNKRFLSPSPSAVCRNQPLWMGRSLDLIVRRGSTQVVPEQWLAAQLKQCARTSGK